MGKFGGVHVFVANAGILRDKSFLAMTEKEWDDVLAVHLRFALVKLFRMHAYLPLSEEHTRVPRLSGRYSNSRSMDAF
jgi:NAD(P)-dependent dehydrogenase (short-subunit alcohol dehydrogenase family)